MNVSQIKELLEGHQFGDLFNRIGWDWPDSDTPWPVEIDGARYMLHPVAHKRGFTAYHCPAMPDTATRAKIETRLSRDVREHLIIFTDGGTGNSGTGESGTGVPPVPTENTAETAVLHSSQSGTGVPPVFSPHPPAKSQTTAETAVPLSAPPAQRWLWVRRAPGQPLARREHVYRPEQPMLLIEKLRWLVVTMDEEDNLIITDIADKVKSAFDVDKVTKRFYERFKKEHDAFLGFIEGITDLGDAKWYASVMLNRLMFIYFIQKKGFLDGDLDYLRNRLQRVQALKGRDRFHTFYRYFLLKLCHEALGRKGVKFDKDLAALIGDVPYLNGGIFQPHEIEDKYGDTINIPDDAFATLFAFFDQYEWHLDNRPTASANEINPDVLGYIFEKYINQKQMGAYYTKEDITEYIGKNTILPCLFDKARNACKIAFDVSAVASAKAEGETAVWSLLQSDPDRYIYPAVRHGVTCDIRTGVELDTPVPYPPEIEIGIETTTPELLERRKQWNTPAPPEAGLPTEIWRETVARRQRYADVRGKLERGDVRDINDLITLNLDIRQFAQDVIDRCESPDLLNAIWVALAGRLPQHANETIKPGITVLDPTCGSGAFLFAALNILEPLYEACLDRMQEFLDEWESSTGVPPVNPNSSTGQSGTGVPPVEKENTAETAVLRSEHRHPNYARFFRSILDAVEKHPSRPYYVYKSIIIHNLFGVDIMKEAVEICKLRLFLKLVAQVEDGKRIEPLPDIDFNIRAGNTLVGFATQEEMKRAMQGDLLAYSTVLPEILEQAEDCDRTFNLFRQAQLDNDASANTAKAKLCKKLAALNDRLNQYLADDYGVAKGTYENFLESHQPFHWFVEFYGIMKTGGFDAIIGNPPWKEYSSLRTVYKVRGYSTESSGNLYALCTERAIRMSKEKGYLSFIVQLPIVCSSRMDVTRQLMSESASFIAVITCDDRPGKLFDGLQHCRSTIFLLQHHVAETKPESFVSGYLRWASQSREFLFPMTIYTPFEDDQFIRGRFPKYGRGMHAAAFRKVISKSDCRLEFYSSSMPTSNFIFYQESAQYWVKAVVGLPYYAKDGTVAAPPHGRSVYLENLPTARIAHAILNSSLFYTYFIAYGDCFHVSNGLVLDLPVPRSLFEDRQLQLIGQKLQQELDRYAERKTIRTKSGNIISYAEFSVGESKPVIDEIDKVLAQHYGFTEEELDYIINYDIKYRMGKDLLEDGE